MRKNVDWYKAGGFGTDYQQDPLKTFSSPWDGAHFLRKATERTKWSEIGLFYQIFSFLLCK